MILFYNLSTAILNLLSRHGRPASFTTEKGQSLSHNAEAARRLPGKQIISLLLQFFRNQLFFYTFILANVA
jgi:hypothetical protein